MFSNMRCYTEYFSFSVEFVNNWKNLLLAFGRVEPIDLVRTTIKSNKPGDSLLPAVCCEAASCAQGPSWVYDNLEILRKLFRFKTVVPRQSRAYADVTKTTSVFLVCKRGPRAEGSMLSPKKLFLVLRAAPILKALVILGSDSFLDPCHYWAVVRTFRTCSQGRVFQ